MKNNNLHIFLILIFLTFTGTFSKSIYGQDESTQSYSEMSLDDLLNVQVTTASKKAENISDAPGIITTITSEEIKYFGANSLTDILQRATSIQPLLSHLFAQNSISVRGDLRSLYDNHVLILMNGRPIRDGISGGLNTTIYSAFPVDMIERIEIVRGPGSVLYGSNAFAGVINIITKSDAQGSSLNVKAGGGSFNTYNGEITGEYAKGDFSGKIGAKLSSIDGWKYNAITARPGGAPNLPVQMTNGRNNVGVATDLAFKGISFLGYYSKNKEDILGILPYTTYKGKNESDRIFLNLGYAYNFSESTELSFNVTHNGTKFTIDEESLVPADHHSSADYLGELTLNSKITDQINLVVGGAVDSRNKNSADIKEAVQPYHFTQLSTYLQADYKPVESLKLIAGGQFNKPEKRDWDFVPRFGAIYNVTDEFGVKALYGQAFRSPWPVEQLLINPQVHGNPDLKPEKIATADFQVFYSVNNIQSSLTYFTSKYSQSIVRSPIPGLPGVITYINKDELRLHGFEFEGKVTLSTKIFLTGNATYQKNLDESKVINYAPNLFVKAGAFYNLYNNLTVGVFNTYFGKPKENKGLQVNPAANQVDLLSVNVTYKQPFALPLELNVYAQNILNSKYNFTEFSRGYVNTLPMGPGTAVYASIGLNL